MQKLKSIKSKNNCYPNKELDEFIKIKIINPIIDSPEYIAITNEFYNNKNATNLEKILKLYILLLKNNININIIELNIFLKKINKTPSYFMFKTDDNSIPLFGFILTLSNQNDILKNLDNFINNLNFDKYFQDYEYIRNNNKLISPKMYALFDYIENQTNNNWKTVRISKTKLSLYIRKSNSSVGFIFFDNIDSIVIFKDYLIPIILILILLIHLGLN